MERTIRTVKAVIRKFLTLEPHSYWSDAIPYCLVAVRHTPAAAHGFPPFTVVTGAVPVLPTQLPELPATFPADPTPADEEQYIEAVLAHTLRIREEAGERLAKRDR